MLEMTDNTDERRQNTGKLVHQLLEERQQVWSLYCQFGELKPFTQDQPVEAKLREFCQLLIDYISLGHFGIYQWINDGTERRMRALKVAEQIYARLAEVTDVVVDFNDKYEKLSGDELRAHLDEDLSRLGEALALRNDLEDQLISAIVA
jgi:regulator of sigma D